MGEKPILFSAPMVNAILGGRKTMTRRVVNPQPEGANCVHEWVDGRWEFGRCNDDGSGEMIGEPVTCSYGKTGDLLWVRETFAASCVDGKDLVFYRADSYPDVFGAKWKPSIFMPRKYSRITLRINEVRVERLQDISEDDAKAEGVEAWHDTKDGTVYSPEFRALWDGINADRGYGWDANPYVWVVSFEKI